jgi:glyoxylate/hydroxypyruvate reductase A
MPHGLGENPMNKGALALLIHGGTENWSPERWKGRFDQLCRDRRVLLMPDVAFDPAEVHYAAVWKPRPGELAAFPNLRVIFNLGAGVDALMADSSLPRVPLVRVAVGDLTGRMTEYVVLHVLMHHRQEPYLRKSQREHRWAPRFQWPARAISVGIMGMGTLGSSAAEMLRLEQKPQADRRHRMLSRPVAAAVVFAAHRYSGLPVAAHAGYTAHFKS